MWAKEMNCMVEVNIMVKENVVVIGTGPKFIELSEWLDEHYNILAVADNRHLTPTFLKWRWISMEEVVSEKYDRVMMCVRPKVGEKLKQQLMNLGVQDTAIDDLEKIDLLQHEADIEKYENDKKKYIEMYHDKKSLRNFRYKENNEYICLSDYRNSAGDIDVHYFWQDILVAKMIIKNKPIVHYDIGSRVDGLVSHLLAAGIDVNIIDIRSLDIRDVGCGMANIHFIQDDATKLENISKDSIESISSCHAYEHFGLGRYGDPVDPDACFVVMEELQRVLSFGGKLYFSVPVGKEEKLCFNAHRIFAPKTIVGAFDKLLLENMYLIHDMSIYEYDLQNVLDSKYMEVLGDYDCGIFIFSKA